MFEDHFFEECLDDELFFFGETRDGLELQFEIVGRRAFVFVEDERVGGDLQGNRQIADNVECRLRHAAFVTGKLRDVNPNSIGQRLLRKAFFLSQFGQFPGKSGLLLCGCT